MTDYSENAIAERLRQVSEARQLGLSLGMAKRTIVRDADTHAAEASSTDAVPDRGGDTPARDRKSS